jgi:hypothetical protein
MAAKTRRPPRRATIEPTFIKAFHLHVEASSRLDALCIKIAALRDAGKLRQARQLMRVAEELRGRIEALEALYRQDR